MNIKDSYDILLLGDSISRGVTYDEEKGKYTTLKESYEMILVERLKAISHNAARFGNTILRGIKKLPKDILKNSPDIAIIEFGGNDCDFNWDEVAKDPSGIHLPNTDYDVFLSSLRELIGYFKNNSITPVLMTLPPIDAERYFKWISKGDDNIAKSILKWLGSVSKIYWWQERYSSAVLSIAQETNTEFIDIRSAFLQKPDFTKLICSDGIHPNREGHRVMADKVLSFFKSKYPFLLRENAL